MSWPFKIGACAAAAWARAPSSDVLPAPGMPNRSKRGAGMGNRVPSAQGDGSWSFGAQGLHIVLLRQKKQLTQGVVLAADADAFLGQDRRDFDLGAILFKVVF